MSFIQSDQAGERGQPDSPFAHENLEDVDTQSRGRRESMSLGIRFSDFIKRSDSYVKLRLEETEELSKVKDGEKEADKQLLWRFRSDEINSCDAARQTLINCNLRVIVYYLRENEANSGFRLGELISGAHEGLCTAVANYRWRTKCEISTYAMFYIRAGVEKAKGEGRYSASIPRDPLRIYRLCELVEAKIRDDGQTPTEDRLLSRLKTGYSEYSWTLEIIRNAKAAVHNFRGSAPEASDNSEDSEETESEIDRISDGSHPGQADRENLTSELLVQHSAGLSPTLQTHLIQLYPTVVAASEHGKSIKFKASKKNVKPGAYRQRSHQLKQNLRKVNLKSLPEREREVKMASLKLQLAEEAEASAKKLAARQGKAATESSSAVPSEQKSEAKSELADSATIHSPESNPQKPTNNIDVTSLPSALAAEVNELKGLEAAPLFESPKEKQRGA